MSHDRIARATELPPSPQPSTGPRLLELAAYFLRLGATAFGGPAAHVAIMERDLVENRRWLERDHFLNLFAAVSALPGPSSTELTLAIGYLRAGLPGLVVAGVAFIFPAFLMMIPLAWIYSDYGSLPATANICRGLDAAVVAVVAIALWRFGRTSLTSGFHGLIFVAAALADGGARFLAATHPIPAADLLILAAAALAGLVRYHHAGRVSRSPTDRSESDRSADISDPPDNAPVILPLASATAHTSIAFGFAATSVGAGLGLLGLLMLKIGATIYGSGYLLIPYLQSSFVDSHHWLTQRQLTDAIAAGQFTPGPLLTTASFVGFFVADAHFHLGPAAGVAGAIVATVGIFLPAFIYVGLLAPILPKIRRSAALSSANAAAVALIFVTTLTLARSAIVDGPTLAIAAAALGLGLLLDINPAFLIAASGIIGWLVYR